MPSFSFGHLFFFCFVPSIALSFCLEVIFVPLVPELKNNDICKIVNTVLV